MVVRVDPLEPKHKMLTQNTKPHFHHNYQINDRIEFELGLNQLLIGVIKGIANDVGLSIAYIVLLDQPLKVPGWETSWEAIPVAGTAIKRIIKDSEK